MKITQDVREYAAQKEIDEQALGVGMKETTEKFVALGGEIGYQYVAPSAPGMNWLCTT